MRKLFVLLTVVGSFLGACSGSNSNAPNLQTDVYFDIKGFFEEEAHRLSQDTNLIHKEISRNGGEKESKSLLIKDWLKEFSLFIESDINKPAWTSSYEVSHEGDAIVYTSNDPELRTKKIRIEKDGETVESIIIHNEVENKLYKSIEELYYSPDSIYRIEKLQDVRVIGANHYLITGSFN
ncbi:hypothetical protein [Albibacterium profundi]|uniref:Uncharacterized protein n=1 Tax=Albibacterium profundi TaxID=3134906 RepID=A0ABV5CBD2_9SPHI